MDKYRKVFKPKEEVVKSDEEIRVTAAGSVSAYVSRAATVFNELNKPFITVVASGNALPKAVTAAEVIKRRFKGLHQITELKTVEIVDEYEPLEEGLDKVIDNRSLPVIEIKLSKEALDTSDKGYQPPLDESQITEYDAEEMARGRGRGGGRGGSKGRGKGKGKDKSSSKGKSKEKDSSSPGKGKSKGKSKGKGEEEPKGKGKGKDSGKSKDKGKGKGKSKSTYDDYYEEPKGKGKGKKGGKSKDQGKGKSKSKYDDYDDYRGGKSKSKGKGKSSSYDSWGYEDSYSRDYNKGSSWEYESKGKSKGKGGTKSRSKGGW